MTPLCRDESSHTSIRRGLVSATKRAVTAGTEAVRALSLAAVFRNLADELPAAVIDFEMSPERGPKSK
jgi:hypothetical protein